MASPNLGIPDIQDTNTPEVEANAAVDLLDQASNDTVDLTIDGDFTVSLVEYNENGELNLVAGSVAADFDLFLPSNKRLFIVTNAAGFDGTAGVDDLGGGFTGSSQVVADGSSALLYSDGTNVTQVRGRVPIDLDSFFPGIPASSQIMYSYVATRRVILADELAGSRGVIGVNPTASFVADVQINAASIGSITISTGGAFTFATTGALEEVIDVGQTIQIIGPGTADATAADISITLQGVGA